MQLHHRLAFDEFQSTRPMRGATPPSLLADDAVFISIHAPHAGRDRTATLRRRRISTISIHAPHAGRDSRPSHRQGRAHLISIHAPHAGRDAGFAGINDGRCRRFQSTRPMRGATDDTSLVVMVSLFQSTRPMRGATLKKTHIGTSFTISIHAPHAGRDGNKPWVVAWHE